MLVVRDACWSPPGFYTVQVVRKVVRNWYFQFGCVTKTRAVRSRGPSFYFILCEWHSKDKFTPPRSDCSIFLPRSTVISLSHMHWAVLLFILHLWPSWWKGRNREKRKRIQMRLDIVFSYSPFSSGRPHLVLHLVQLATAEIQTLSCCTVLDF